MPTWKKIALACMGAVTVVCMAVGATIFSAVIAVTAIVLFAIREERPSEH